MITKSNKYLNLVSELFPFTIGISHFGCDFVNLQLHRVTHLFWFQVFEGFIKLTEKNRNNKSNCVIYAFMV